MLKDFDVFHFLCVFMFYFLPTYVNGMMAGIVEKGFCQGFEMIYCLQTFSLSRYHMQRSCIKVHQSARPQLRQESSGCVRVLYYIRVCVCMCVYVCECKW